MWGPSSATPPGADRDGGREEADLPWWGGGGDTQSVGLITSHPRGRTGPAATVTEQSGARGSGQTLS